MIHWYFDLDNVVFDFDKSFIQLVNETLGKTLTTGDLRDHGIERCLGLSRPTIDSFLRTMTAQNRWATIPIADIVHVSSVMLCYTTLSAKGLVDLTFITSRGLDTLPQTIRSLKPICFHTPSIMYSNHKYGVYKHGIISALSDAEGGVFIDDNPLYINEVYENCPGTVCVWCNLNHRYDRPEGLKAHYEVNSWVDIEHLLIGRHAYGAYAKEPATLIKESKAPGIQLEIR